MNNKEINIAEILKDIPGGTKLWSPIMGEVKLNSVKYNNKTCTIFTRGTDRCWYTFTRYGHYYTAEGAEMLLFPSRDMKDWSKFFKEGDVLENTTDNVFPKYVIFKKFVDDKYTTFEAINGLILGDVPLKYSIQNTLSYSKVEDEDMASEIKKKIQKIIARKSAVSELLQPFNKVLVRDCDTQPWLPAFYCLKIDETGAIYITSCGPFRQCVPYNEKTKHLLGTTDPYEP